MTRQCHPTSLAWRPQMSEPRIYGRSVSPNKRWDVMHKFQFQCVYCGRTSKDSVLDIDHVVPIAAGGTNDIENLVPACVECNMGKGAKRLENLPLAIRKQAFADDEEYFRERFDGWLVAGCLLAPPLNDYDMMSANGVSFLSPHFREIGMATCLAKAAELRNDDLLDNRERFSRLLFWTKDYFDDKEVK
jgi:hypothetical protein